MGNITIRDLMVLIDAPSCIIFYSPNYVGTISPTLFFIHPYWAVLVQYLGIDATTDARNCCRAYLFVITRRY